MQRLRKLTGRGLYKEVLQAAPTGGGAAVGRLRSALSWAGPPHVGQQGAGAAGHSTAGAACHTRSKESRVPTCGMTWNSNCRGAPHRSQMGMSAAGVGAGLGAGASDGGEVVERAQARPGRGLQARYPATRCGAAGSRQAGKSAEDGSSLLDPLGHRNAKDDQPWALGPVLPAHPGPGCSCCWAREAWPPHQSSTAGTATAPCPPGHSGRGRGKASEKREARRPTKIPPPGCP